MRPSTKKKLLPQRFGLALAGAVLSIFSLASQAHAFELELISIRCNDAQESRDEPYLLVNNHIEWGPVEMRTGSRSLIGQRVVFDHGVTVELRESDGRRYDYIGRMSLSESQVRVLIRGDRSTLTHSFRRDRGIVGDASYTLTYELRE